jgi:uncharacterized membrane protein YhaH (DUF805 family)
VNVLSAFWLSVGIAVGISTLTVLLLRRSLGVLLVELCGTAGRARFWAIFSSVSIVLTALFGMLTDFPISGSADWAAYPQIPVVLAAFRQCLAFLLFSLGTLGFALLIGISSFERRRLREPPRIGDSTTLQV